MRFSMPIPLAVTPQQRATADRSASGERVPPGMDEAQFQAFYEDTGPKLLAYIRRAVGDAALAEDILQDSFLRFLRTSPCGLDARQRTAYVYRTATSLLVDHWRRVKRGRQWSVKTWFENTTPEPSSRAFDVTRLFQQLKPQQQALLWLAYVEGFDHGEIAAALQLREPSVRVLLYRARKKMAGILSTHGLAPQDASRG